MPLFKRSKNTKMTATNNLKLVIFLGSTREGRLGQRVCNFVQRWLQDNKTYDVHLCDPLEMDLPLLKKPIHFYKPAEQGSIPEILSVTNQKIKEADAFLLISCEYNHCIPPALANIFDHFPGSSFSWRPSGLITYSPGIYGGMRAAMQLRALTGELGCISVSNIFGIPKVHEALTEDGQPKDTNEGKHMDSGINNLMKQLEWHAIAMKKMRDEHGLPK